MERLLRFFVDRHLIVHVIVLVTVVAGTLAATRMGRETFPNVTMPKLIVRATLPGASARADPQVAMQASRLREVRTNLPRFIQYKKGLGL